MSAPTRRAPVVNRTLCVGSTSCTQMAPGVFEVSDDGYAEVVDPRGADEAAIQQAIDYCPAQALGWAD
jgi:ferredoxin